MGYLPQYVRGLSIGGLDSTLILGLIVGVVMIKIALKLIKRYL